MKILELAALAAFAAFGASVANSGGVGPPLRKKSDFFKEIDIYE